MTNHYDKLRVAPDPAKTEELRHLLHARLANVSADDARGRSGLELDPGSRPDERTVPTIELSPPDRSTTNQRTHRRRLLVAAAAIVGAIAAASIATRIEDSPRVATTPSTPTTPTTVGSSCPLTAEDVSEAIGTTVTGPTSVTACEFVPAPDTVPGVGSQIRFGYRPASACTPESLRDADAVDGLGVDAYLWSISLGVTVLVCNGHRPFEVHVEFMGDDSAAAVALARLVLNG